MIFEIKNLPRLALLWISWVTGPDGRQVYSAHRQAEDEFQIRGAGRGVYTFCLLNYANAPETVDLHIWVQPDPPLLATMADVLIPRELAKDGPVEDALRALAGLQEQLGQIEVDQHYFRARYARRRLVAESTSRRLVCFALLEVAVLVGASVTQVVILRRMFERRYRSSSR
eukprot:jgi/Mesen1/4737/ME000241S03783